MTTVVTRVISDRLGKVGLTDNHLGFVTVIAHVRFGIGLMYHTARYTEWWPLNEMYAPVVDPCDLEKRYFQPNMFREGSFPRHRARTIVVLDDGKRMLKVGAALDATGKVKVYAWLDRETGAEIMQGFDYGPDDDRTIEQWDLRLIRDRNDFPDITDDWFDDMSPYGSI